MTDVQRLMLTLPNNGSTWFAGLLAKHLPGCRYYDKEFFNPICNTKYAHILTRNFGSELISCYRNIAKRGDLFITADINATWGNEDYTFTKETYSPFKIPIFSRMFRCFVFLRETKNCFPPRRARVWSFYEHAWYALREANHDVIAKTLQLRAREAHSVMSAALLNDASLYAIPVIWYEELFGESGAVNEAIHRAVGLELPELVAEIVETRRVIERPPV